MESDARAPPPLRDALVQTIHLDWDPPSNIMFSTSGLRRHSRHLSRYPDFNSTPREKSSPFTRRFWPSAVSLLPGNHHSTSEDSTVFANMESVVVVGGCGALGRRLITELLKLDSPPRNVYVFDMRIEDNVIPSAQYHQVDITNKDQVISTFQKLSPVPDVVFHTASPRPGLLDLPMYLNVNVEGTRNLIQGAEVCNSLSWSGIKSQARLFGFLVREELV